MVASSTPMTNQPPPFLMIFPSAPPKISANVRATHKGGNSGAEGSTSPNGTEGGNEGDS